MANPLVDNLPVKLGQLIPVYNMDRRTKSEFDHYIALHIEDIDGSNERCVLFTSLEHTDMESVKLPEDITKNMIQGRLYPCTLGARSTNLVATTHWDGRVRILRISPSQLARLDKRASKHPETCPKKSFITDMLD